MKLGTILVLLIMLAIVCFAQDISRKKILKIKVLSSGQILLENKSVTLDKLEKELSRLKEKEGAIWYYREQDKAEPPEQAMRVMELVVKYNLPISLSSKPDFSDYIDEKGISHKRENND